MLVLIKTDSIFLKPNTPARKGLVDTSKLGVEDAKVKELIKKFPEDIEEYKGEKPKTPPAGGNQGGNGNTPPAGGNGDAPKPEAYDDITGQQLIDFLAKKGVDHEFNKSQKKELYPIYTGHFSDPDKA